MGTKKAVSTAAILAASMIIEHRKDRGSNLIMQEFGVKKIWRVAKLFGVERLFEGGANRVCYLFAYIIFDVRQSIVVKDTPHLAVVDFLIAMAFHIKETFM